MLVLQLSIVVLKEIRAMANKKEDYYGSDMDRNDFDLHGKFFTASDVNAMGCKARDMDFVIDLTARAQLMMEDDNLTEDALRRLAPRKE